MIQESCAERLLYSHANGVLFAYEKLTVAVGDQYKLTLSLSLSHPFYKDAQKLADKLGVPYIECSAKTGENVAEVFHTLLKEIEKDDGLLAGESGDGGCHIL